MAPTRRQASQSQRPANGRSQRDGPARSQATRRARVESDDEVDENEMDVDAEHSEAENAEGEGGAADIRLKAADLVRLALFHEARRMPLRREDINKKVLPNSTRIFKAVFDRAQSILHETFGLQLQELPSKAGLDQEAAAASAEKKGKKSTSGTQDPQGEDELEEARKATMGKRRATAVGSKTYILRSILDARLIEIANKTDASIVEEEALLNFATGDLFGGDGNSGAGAAIFLDDDDEWDDGAELHPRTYGSIFSWGQNDQLGALGVLYVILALILVNGKVVQERALRGQLKELGLPSTAGRSPILFTTIATHRAMKVDDYLSLLLRQGYLDRQIVGEVSGAGRKRARGKVGGDAHNDMGMQAGDMYEWRWGARAFCEVGETDIAKFVAEFMVNYNTGGKAGDEEEDDEGTEGRKKTKVEKMYMGVRKAAGGSLAAIRDWNN
ncbi:hypothetical protein AGABI2DRAFT_122375 [Agaricus bisporus var. bisporus H97]|uniref:hypothetical protein n=1 Tax=Agaricus bisporus var. bisporus (strain H97 / ATCC MYA-4626 / FGSC 10389) TaxID=936046 RepID=UPI00029F4F01|nr:hypothetical protein AGABI2DRAFT_122375 [Agaricus bisporus var. bisporus H97]EKV42793.1 hypothetical protein AGABI2DRAFT_122375 [Agaricus bisporus var. bisporus H97]